MMTLTNLRPQDAIRLEVIEYNPDKDGQDSTWSMMKVKSDNLTDYSLMEDEAGKQIIKAKSNNAAGGLIYKTRIDPQEFPIIEWR